MKKLDYIGEFFAALEAGTVVDLGCGDGAFLQAALGKMRGWKSAFGIDPSFRAVEKASERFKDDMRVSFVQAGAEKLPLKKACADLALVSMSVHHMERPRLAMAEAFRVLSPGGALAVHEPVDEKLDASQLLREEYHAIRGEIEKAQGGFMRPILRIDELRALLSGASFSPAREYILEHQPMDGPRAAAGMLAAVEEQASFIPDQALRDGILSRARTVLERIARDGARMPPAYVAEWRKPE